MKLVVMKFGGTSVGSIDKINNVANIVENQSNDKKLIVPKDFKKVRKI